MQEFSEGHAIELDQHDVLSQYKEAFVIEDPEEIYLLGNSLGRLPIKSRDHLQQVISEEWGKSLIRGWNNRWYDLPISLGNKIGDLLGAAAGSVTIADATSVNLFKLATAALRLQEDRQDIISDTFNFPSDLYILQGIIKQFGNQHQLKLIDSADNIHPDLDRLYQLINDNTALVVLSHVVFKSGYRYDVKAITERAHSVGALVLWDLSHSVGVMPIELDEWQVDLAIGCTYKYLNSGPGAPAFLYVRKDLQNKLMPTVSGWFAHKNPFALELEFEPVANIRRFLTGTPPILSMSGIEAGVDLCLQAGKKAIYQKSQKLVAYFISLVEHYLLPYGFTIATPTNSEHRGSHVTLQHPEAYRISRVLLESKNMPVDFREPDNLRMGLAPLYISFSNIFTAIQRLKAIMDDKQYLNISTKKMPVT